MLLRLLMLKSAAWPEWSSFFAAGKAGQKIAGTEDGTAAQIILNK